MGAGLFLAFLTLYAYLAGVVPDRFSVDGYLNYGATRYLAEHKRLPVVDAENKDIVFSQIGATRSLRPPLTYILNGWTHVVFDPVVGDSKWSMRLGSSFLGAAVVLITYIAAVAAMGSVSYGFLAAVLVGLLPRIVMLATTNNDDIGAIFSVALLSAAVVALWVRTPGKLTVACLFFAIGVIFITKFTAWICLPAVALIAGYRLWHQQVNLLRWAPLALLIMLIGGGWWLLFNIFHYGVLDPTALGHASDLQRQITGSIQNAEGYWTKGISTWSLLFNYDNFIATTFTSIVGAVYWIEMPVSHGLLIFYAVWLLVFAVGLARLFTKDTWLLSLGVALLILLQLAVYLHHNLQRDIQPDGRYLLPIIVPLVLVSMIGLRAISDGSGVFKLSKNASALGLALLLVVLFLHNLITHWLAHGLALFAG